jgi:hypothetical protein
MLEGFQDDLRSLGVPAEASIGTLIAAAIEAPPLKARQPNPSRPERARADDAAAIAAVPPAVWEALDALKPEEAVSGIEIVRAGGAVELARAMAQRLAVMNDDMSDGLRTARLARLLMAQAPLDPTPEQRRAAASQLRRCLYGPTELMREARAAREAAGMMNIWAADHFVAQRLLDVRRATHRHDAAAANAVLDQIAALSIGESTLAIDAIYLLEQHGRIAEADEIYAEYLDDAEAAMETTPDNASAMNRVAWFCARTGRNLERAHQLALTATRLSPRNAALQDTFAEAAFRMGHEREALAAETSAQRSRPDYEFMIRQVDRFKAGLAAGDADRALRSEAWDE